MDVARHRRPAVAGHRRRRGRVRRGGQLLELAFIDFWAQIIEFRVDRIEIEVADASCPSDVDGDGETGFADLIAVLSAWGVCADCPEDVTGDDVVNLADLLAVLSAWGPCQ